MVDFADIGRADPIGSIQQWQKHESDLQTQATNRAVNDLRMTQVKQQMDIQNRQEAQRIQKEKKLDMPLPLEVLKMRTEGGGVEGSVGAFDLKVAEKYGFIDMSQGGDGTITPRNMAQLNKIMKQPDVLMMRNRTRVNFARSQVTQATEALAKKPDDEKAQTAFQQASTFLTQALNTDKAFTTKVEKDVRTNAIKNYEYGLKHPGFAAQPEKGLSVTLFNPQTKKTVQVRRGSNYYNQFIKQGYQEGVPPKAPQSEKGLAVKLYNPTTGEIVEARRGSDYYRQFLQNGYKEGIPEAEGVSSLTQEEIDVLGAKYN